MSALKFLFTLPCLIPLLCARLLLNVTLLASSLKPHRALLPVKSPCISRFWLLLTTGSCYSIGKDFFLNLWYFKIWRNWLSKLLLFWNYGALYPIRFFSPSLNFFNSVEFKLNLKPKRNSWCNAQFCRAICLAFIFGLHLIGGLVWLHAFCLVNCSEIPPVQADAHKNPGTSSARVRNLHGTSVQGQICLNHLALDQEFPSGSIRFVKEGSAISFPSQSWLKQA